MSTPDALTVVHLVLIAALWLFLALACIILYRAFRLPSLLWIMVYFPLAYIALETSRFYFHHISLAESAGPSTNSSAAVAVGISTLLEDFAALLLAVIVVADLCRLLRRAYPDGRSLAVDALSRWHAQTTAFGIGLIVLLLASPLPAIICFYSYVH
jgi:hypothetical protein